MKEIYIRPEGVISMSSKVRSMSSKAGSIGQNVRRIVNSLDWEVSAKGSIGNMASEIGRRTERLAEDAMQLGDLARKGAQDFRNADVSLARNMESLFDNMGKVSKAVAKLTLGSNVKMSTDGRSKEDFFKKASDWLGGVWEGTKNLAKDVWDGISSLLGKIKGFFKENSIVNHVLDGLQFALDIVGLVPVFGEIADGVNALIYTLRGDYVSAALSAAAIIPFAGWFATGGKFINKGIKLLDKAEDIYGIVKSAAKAAGDLISTVKNLLKSNVDKIFERVKSVFKYGDNLKLTTPEGIEVTMSRADLKAELKASGMTEDAAESAIKCMENGCFPGDTLVFAKDGYRRIDQIRESELVLAKDVNTGEISYKPVKQVYIKSSSEFIRLSVEGEEIRTTASHLFFTDSGWWKAAENIKEGDKILGSDGIMKKVEGVTVEQLDEPESIYNLHVEDYHTYFVGSLRLLVHNDCTTEMMIYGREAIEKARAQGITDSATLSKIGTNASADIQRTIENNIALAKTHGITDPVELEKITTDAANALKKPIGEARGIYSRTQAELDALALDPANGKMKLLERDAALGCEANGQIPGPITRSADPIADFVDVNGKAWDVKAFRTDWLNGYDFNTAISEIHKEIFENGQNVIIDTKYLAKWAHDELIAEIISRGWGRYVRFYP